MAAPLGVFVAAGTRREIVMRLSQSVNDAVRNPEVVARMAAIGMEPVGLAPEQYEKNLREEHERLGTLIRRIGMRLD
jgi:tripartite-type tricarboxylate transporter receptor subunit TctC